MPSTVEKDEQPVRRKKTRKKKPVWKRVSAWVGAILIGSLTIALKSSLSPVFTETINHVTETGDPVIIENVITTPNVGDEYAFSGVFSADDIATLNKLDNIDRDTWLALKGGAPIDNMDIRVALVGNRADGASVMDIKPDFKCQDPVRGTLFFAPPQEAVQTEKLFVNFDHSNTQVTNEQHTPYFQNKTVLLKKDEPIILDFTVTSTQRYCAFTLKMTVSVDGKTQTENIQNHGRSFLINGSDTLAKYSVVYVGPPFCDDFVKKTDHLADLENSLLHPTGTTNPPGLCTPGIP